jgi:hypothetical protein
LEILHVGVVALLVSRSGDGFGTPVTLLSCARRKEVLERTTGTENMSDASQKLLRNALEGATEDALKGLTLGLYLDYSHFVVIDDGIMKHYYFLLATFIS